MPRSTAKLLVAMLLLALLGTSLAVAADGEDGSKPGDSEQPELSATPIPEAAEEIPAERTATTRTYELPDGSHAVEVFQTPINYRAPDGGWKPIKVGLHELEGDAGIANGQNRFDLRLPEVMGEEAVRLSEGERWISYRLLGPSAPIAELDGAKATYESPRDAVAFEMTSLPFGLKEDIRLEDASAPSAYAFELKLSDDLTPKLVEGGSVRVEGPAGKLFALIPAPLVEDSSGGLPAPARAASYELEPAAKGSWQLTVRADRDWLEAPDRVFPVRLDPTVAVGSTGFSEAAIVSTPAPNGYGIPAYAHQTLPIGRTQSIGQTIRYVGKYPVSLPAGSSAYDATLSVYSYSTAVNTPGAELMNLTQEPFFGVDWTRASIFGAPVNWTTPGGTFDPTPLAAIKTSERPEKAGPGWWNFSSPALAETVNKWISGGDAANKGVLIRQTNEFPSAGECSADPSLCAFRQLEIYSNTATNVALRPKLVIKYWEPAPASAKVVSPVDGTRTAKRLKLQATWTSGVTGITWQYREGNAGLFQDVPVGLVRDGEGKAVAAWPVETKSAPSEPLYLDAAQLSASLRKKGGPIQVRALFEGGAKGVSGPVEAKVDPALGGPKDATASVGPGSVDLLTGNFTVTRTDVSIPTFNSSLDFSRTHSSRDAANPGNTGVLGPGWKPGVPVEENGAGEWRSVKLVTESESFEGETFSFTYALAIGVEGAEVPFEKVGSNTYRTPDELTGWTLTANAASPTEFVLRTPDGTKTTFNNNGSGAEYLPVEVSQPGASSNSTRMTYEVKGGNRRLSQIVAPTVPGIDCVTNPKATAGCKVLSFNYAEAGTWGAEAALGARLTSITYTAAYLGGPWTVAEYKYDTTTGRLKEAWDPRISPALKETYAYESTGQVKTITPPGLKPWTMEYGTLNEEEVSGRLLSVKRDSLGAGMAQTTISYGAPLSGGSGLEPMTGADVADWNQKDVPVDATAIFPPDQVPTSFPPSDYSGATVYYMDSDGYAVNTATPKGAGTVTASISTTETDKYGNVVRELTPQNRLRALEATNSVTASQELDTRRVYEDEGTEMAEEIGPLHDVRIQHGPLAGQIKQARSYRYVKYDEVTGGQTLPTPTPHLPTTEETAAKVGAVLHDSRVNKTEYDWVLRKPTTTIVDAGTEPGDLNIESVTTYNSSTGLATEIRQPSDAKSAGAGSTRTFYYGTQAELDATPGAPGSCGKAQYAGLPCVIEPAAQPGTGGMPQVKVTRIAAYNELGQPTEVWEAPGRTALNAGTPRRTTTTTYDSAGRTLTVKQTGGGTAVPTVKLEYSTTTGAPTTQRFVCDSNCGAPIYASAFGSAGAGNGQFGHPSDVAVDASGNLWVADEQNNRIQKFDAGGNFISKFGGPGSGNGQFNRPTSIAIDPASGNLWVADAGNHRIQKFNPAGEYLTKVGSYGSGNGQFHGPEGIAIDANANIWIADTYNHRIQKLNGKGEFLKVVGSQGTGAGQLERPTSLDAAPNGDVWVADWQNNRVSAFAESGTFVRQITGSGSGNGQLERPDAVDVDPQGNVWVGDRLNSRVQQFTQQGAYVDQFGAGGSGEGQFNFSYPMGIASDGKGNLWIADTNNNRIQKWSPDDQAVTTTYDALGRATSYQDADGNTSTVTYDLLGRPLTTNDGKGTQTRTYDPTSGLLVELEDSAAGTFTAAYDADGNLTEEVLPNGLVAEQTFDETGQLTDLLYEKAGSAWLDFDSERSIHGQILRQTSLTSTQEYSYDDAGRLTQTKDTPASGNCVTRQYAFDANSNRLSLNTREGVGPTCNTTSGGTEQKYEYDGSDRLKGEGILYDDYGRITSLPAVFAGGKALSTSYFATDMVASQTQDGVTNTFQLDAALRQRQRVQGGGLEGVEVFHYAGGSDTPAWTQLGTDWSRNISGIGGGVGAIQDSSSGTLLQLSNLHGDVVATATLNPSDTEPVSTFENDEFGVPKLGGAPQFGWLGKNGRRTELASGVIQMGVRSYVPALGRFLTPDPILGGSANPYEYAGQDPVNAFDLTGMACKKKNPKSTAGSCKQKQGRGEKGVRNVLNHLRERLKNMRERRMERLAGGWPAETPSITSPLENAIEKSISMGAELLQEIDAATTCKAAAVSAVNGTAWYSWKAAHATTEVIRTAASRMAAKFSVIGAAAVTANAFGFC